MGLAVLLPALVAYPQAIQPLAIVLMRDYLATLQKLGQEPDPELLSACVAALAKEAPPP